MGAKTYIHMPYYSDIVTYWLITCFGLLLSQVHLTFQPSALHNTHSQSENKKKTLRFRYLLHIHIYLIIADKPFIKQKTPSC